MIGLYGTTEIVLFRDGFILKLQTDRVRSRAAHSRGLYTGCMAVRIAIPEPTSSDAEYNQRSLPQYVEALKAAGADVVVVPLSETQERVAKLLAGVQGILLPGSGFDADPQRYGEAREPECAEADPARIAADEFLLREAFNLRKPILAICAGTQNLNVWRGGALVQDLKTAVNHQPGREVVKAHPVEVTSGSRLQGILPAQEAGDTKEGGVEVGKIEVRGVEVNSSHHQAVRTLGDNLKVSAVSPGDGVIEAVELDAPDHFVVGVQWHPERTYTQSGFSRAIFSAFVQAAEEWQPPEFEGAEKQRSGN